MPTPKSRGLARHSSLPVAASHAISSPPTLTIVFSSGASASSATLEGGRNREVPRRSRAPEGRGSPSESTAAGWLAGGCA